MWIFKGIFIDCFCWIPQLHRVRYSQCFCWSREDKTTDADDEKQRLRWNVCIIWKWDRDGDSLINWLNRFVCHMYGWKGKDSVNNIRYWMYCQSGAKIASEKLPPCEDVLQLHILRANYHAFIWRQSLLAQQAENDPP